MKTILVDFYISSRYVNTETEETVEIEVEEDATEEEIEEVVREYFEDWVWENIEASFNILTNEK